MTRRGRPKKVGLKRIDAAIDALLPLGFSKELICKTVDNLLKVYEGDSGWVFIEEASYKLLIETILEEQEKSLAKGEDSVDDGVDVLDFAVPDDIASIEGTSADPVIVGHITERGDSPAADTTCEAAGAVSTSMDPPVRRITGTGPQEYLDWKDISCDSKKMLGNEHGTSLSFSEPVKSSSCCRRRPCYGWISDNDSEGEDARVDEFSQGPSIQMGDFGKWRKRKTLWDMTPDKML